MSIFSKRILIIILIIVSIIFLSIINFKINNSKKSEINKNPEQEINIIENKNEIKKEKINEENKNYNWYIEIKSINLKAPIAETTEMNILEDYVGHFSETSLTVGNIGLAGHNKGYKNNYFENLNKAKKGDEITYKYNDYINKYIIDKIEIIKNTNWDNLENTKENKITLITCLEDKPEHRLCVQATEKNN